MAQWRKHRGILLILLLLCGEITWLLSNLQIIHLPFLGPSHHNDNRREAGYVIQARQDLKKRAPDSLIWENSKEKDVLFYQDSILTLSQSSATLYLNDETELHLSENTLVSLEEPDDRSSSEIRLRFSKGDVRARNPFAKTQLSDGDWTVTLDKGTDVSLRKDQGSVELEVHQGKAVLQNSQGEQILDDKEILKIQNGKIDKLSKNESLHWRKSEPVRHYTVTDEDVIPLEWEGTAQKILVQKLNAPDQTITVTPEQISTNVVLPPGSFRLRLQDQEGVSEPLDVEVWRAPHILLRKPLPRDRIKTYADQEFIWSLLPEIKEYRLKLFNADRSYEKTYSQEANFIDLRFEEEKDLFWQVEGLDHDGHTIPSFYENSLYIRHDPLEAPKLKTPLLRKPAGRRNGASLWNLLVPMAQAAEEEFEAVFQWEPVSQADQYVIEISSQPDFRTTEVNQTVRETQFVWRKFSGKKYYWRVAAGTSKGRMGVFSEAVELKVQDLKLGEEADINGVHVKKLEKVVRKAKEPPAPEKVEVAKAEPTPTPVPQVVRALQTQWTFAYAPSGQNISLHGEQESNVNLSGLVRQGFMIETNRPLENERELAISLLYNSQTWTPSSASEFPFQDDLKVSQIFLNMERGSNISSWRWGLSINEDNTVGRISGENVSMTPIWMLGPRMSYVRNFWKAGLAVVTSGKVFDVVTDVQAKATLFRINSMSFFGGFQGNAVYQMQTSGGGSELRGFLLLGIDFLSPPAESPSH